MKKIVGKVSLFLGVLLLAGSVFAGPFFGWQTIVRATDGVNIYTESPAAPSQSACEMQRQDAINDFLAMGYTVISAPNCTPIPFRLPRWIVEWDEIRWPWPGPVCLSCPLIVDEDFIRVVYPRDFDRVRTLVDDYQIEQYNKELLGLQKKYNLEGFEKEMFGIELNQELEQLGK